ncbi:MAG: S9 family peptidase [Bacteroidales bacterium]|jgi:oligopeptidase B|nr:S9 family peptidase [Bacteroidales bacterium]
MKPPKAEKIPVALVTAGHLRYDAYFWLKERDNPKVIAYLEEENAYTGAMMKDTKDLQAQLFEEITSRIRQDDRSVPFFYNGYWYYTRYGKDSEYVVECRRKGTMQAEEEILLDENELSRHYAYFDINHMEVSPDNRRVSYGVDTVGNHLYTVYVKQLETGEILARIDGAGGATAWANDNQTLFYCSKDPQTLRADRLMKYHLGSGKTTEIYYEADEKFDLGVFSSKSGEIIFLESESNTATEFAYLRSDSPDGCFTVIQPREEGLEYHPGHYRDKFYIITNDRAKNFRLVETLLEHPTKDHWKEVIPHRDDVLLEEAELFDDYIALSERKNGLLRLRIISLRDAGEYCLDFGEEEVYTAELSDNPTFNTCLLRIEYSSLTTPCTIFDFNMLTHEKTILKQQEVVGGYQQDEYVSRRIYAEAADKTVIPISLVHRKDTPINGKTPLLLYGYGAYGYNVDPTFSISRISLLNRGFVYAIAHVRGSQYLGREWYENGKLLKKRNTFTDFIACAEHLIAQKYTDAEHLFAMGASAGGMLMGAVLNMRPDLFGGVIADVPFVDVVTTMSDTSIPLTAGEFDEWGNPEEEEYYRYMMSYSPYDNVKAQDCPNLLVTAGLNDAEVQYWEPAKWVAKLREHKTGNNLLLLHTNMEAGHEGASGRFESFRETALEYAFLIKLGITK